MPDPIWVSTTPGVPNLADFASTGNAGTPIIINAATKALYYLAAGNTVTAVPTGTGGGGTPYVVTTRTAGYTETATTGEQLALCSLAGGFTAILPAASGNVAKLGFKKMLAAGQITISRAGTDLIDGASTAVLNNQYEAITLMSDGSANWEIV